jgi:hypothetical protein
MKKRTVFGAVAGALAVASLGFRIRPRPVHTPVESLPASPDTVALPADLPEPVDRFYHSLGIEGAAPVIDTFALWGRAWMRLAPLPRLPVTFWSEHKVGWNGRQRLTVTWFGLPVLRGMDDYVDGHGHMRIGRQLVQGPSIDQGENLFLWAELLLVPSALATRPSVRWEPVDTEHAILHVPFGAGSERLTARFDPITGRLAECVAQRFRTPGQPKLGWHITYDRWAWLEAGWYPTRISVRWADQDRPWFVLDVDGVAVNVPVDSDLTGSTDATVAALETGRTT